MSTWLSFVTGSFAGPVCLAVTIVGLVLSAIAWRKKGARSGTRGIAWSLLPLAAYLTHSLALVGRLVSAVVQFGASFVFSPKAWLGVILVGIAVLLFLISGGIPLFSGGRKRRKAKERKAAAAEPPAVSAGRGKAGPPAAPDDDDLSDVREILKRRGIS